MNYAQIRKMDISNGPGIRVSIFVQGCDFHCKGCFNSSTWDFNGGKPFTAETKEYLFSLVNEHIAGLSILGGEPLNMRNVATVKEICKEFKEIFPGKSIWIWTGFRMEDLNESQKEIFNYVDVLVDGQFVEELKDFRLKYCGSSNQRVIEIKKN